MSTYVIREKNFGYNDETYYVVGHQIKQVFDNQQEAEHVYKQLEIAAARNFPLYEVESLFNASEEELQALDEFVFSRCGKHILSKNGAVDEDTLPDELNPEDTFEFIKRADMYSYQLISFENEAKFYGLWLKNSQNWAKEEDEFSASLVYAASQELLSQQLGQVFSDYDYDDIILQGSLADLSDHPILVQSIIDAHEGLNYDQKDQTLTIQAWDDEALAAIHSLLKQPLFEMREISLAEVQQIENKLHAEYDYDEDEYTHDDEDTEIFNANVEAMINQLATALEQALEPKNK